MGGEQRTQIRQYTLCNRNGKGESRIPDPRPGCQNIRLANKPTPAPSDHRMPRVTLLLTTGQGTPPGRGRWQTKPHQLRIRNVWNGRHDLLKPVHSTLDGSTWAMTKEKIKQLLQQRHRPTRRERKGHENEDHETYRTNQPPPARPHQVPEGKSPNGSTSTETRRARKDGPRVELSRWNLRWRDLPMRLIGNDLTTSSMGKSRPWFMTSLERSHSRSGREL